jgi:hypothetical protein
MRCGAPALDHVIEFGISAHAVVADQQARIDRGVGGDQVFDQRENGIARIGDAKQYFKARVGELKCGKQRLRGVVVDSTQRAHQADRRVVAGVRRRLSAQPDDRDRNAGDLNRNKESAQDRSGENRNRHRREW